MSIQSPRKCSTCELVKPIEEYKKQHHSQGGYRAQCRTCYNEKRRVNYVRNVNGMRDKYAARFKQFGAEQRIRREYGLEPYQLESLILAQGGYCAICGILMDVRPGVRTSNRMVVDHCHITGKVRSLLCNMCNLGLGHFRDKSENLVSAIDYLNHF